MAPLNGLCLGWLLLIPVVLALKFDDEQLKWNLNTNRTATHPLDYAGEWEDHEFHPSPSNWRMPFYTLMLDRFVNGNPSNDDANGTQFEQDITQTQLRHGGDIQGLEDSLDYLQGMGIKVRRYRSLIRTLLMLVRYSTLVVVLTSTYPGLQTPTALWTLPSLTITLVR